MRVGYALPHLAKTLTAAQQDAANAAFFLLLIFFINTAAEHLVLYATVSSHVANHPRKAVSLIPTLDEPLGPRRHHLRQSHQASGVTRGGGIKDDMLISFHALFYYDGHLFQQGGFLHAGGISAQSDMLVNLPMPGHRHQLLQGSGYLLQMARHHLGRVQFQCIQPSCQPPGLGSYLLRKQMPKVMRRVGRNQQHPPPTIGQSQRRSRRHGSFAGAPLAAKEQEFFALRQVYKHKPTSISLKA